MRNGLRPIRKRLGAEEYMKGTVVLGGRTVETSVLKRWGFRSKKRRKRDDIKELETDLRSSARMVFLHL